jgi:hypothetical protein
MLDEAQRRLGGVIGRRGDASEALGWLCIVGTDNAGRWVHWLESSELGGDTIDVFALQRIFSGAVVDSRCVQLGTKSEIYLPLNLRLGFSEQQIMDVLGQPTMRLHNTLIFGHEHTAAAPRNEPYTVPIVSNTLYIVLHSGIVQTIQVWKDSIS